MQFTLNKSILLSNDIAITNGLEIFFFHIACRYFKTVVAVPLQQAFSDIAVQESPEAPFVELHDVGKLMLQPGAVLQKVLHGGVVQVNGITDGNGHPPG